VTRPLSPGVAFGCTELLRAVSRNKITPAGVLSLALSSISAEDILGASLALRWLEVAVDGFLTLTAGGERALAVDDDRFRLRLLVLDHVETERPPWLYLASAGRRETLLQAPAGIRQVLVEAGLAYGDDDDAVAFWDGLAARARGTRDISLTETGRRGERLTIARERERTGRPQKWIALDSSSDGYDVLSQLSSEDRRRLTIEVKASERSLSYANFHLTRNEWDRAQDFLHHEFHLWDLSAAEPCLAIVSVLQMADHVSLDNGEGIWESVAIPFRAFAAHFCK
jgi:Domain of unknown function (DUF3883)